MKKVLTTMVLIVIAFSLFGFVPLKVSKTNSLSAKVIKQKLFSKVHVNFTVRSTNGCSFHIVGDVEYHLCCPPGIDGFVGDVTIGGESNCPHGTFHFVAQGTLTESGDVTSLTYSEGDEVAISALTDSEVDGLIRAELSNAIKADS